MSWKILFTLFSVLALAGCINPEGDVTFPDGSVKHVKVALGYDALPDLLIIDGKVLYGTAIYSEKNETKELGFKLETGESVRVDCGGISKEFLESHECEYYVVTASSLDLVPVGTLASNPDRL